MNCHLLVTLEEYAVILLQKGKLRHSGSLTGPQSPSSRESREGGPEPAPGSQTELPTFPGSQIFCP